MSLAWKNILMRLYKSGQIDVTVLDQAVNDGMITEEEKQEILNA